MANCKHKWVHIESIYKTKDYGYHVFLYMRIDRFFCEKCLDQTEKVKEEQKEKRPDWYKGE